MQLLELIPGSEEWIAAGLKYHRASEAPMMMGVSRHVSRTELLSAHALGREREFSDWVRKNLLDKGHEIEAKARAIVEARIGEDLYPVVGLSDCGKYMASFDGLTMCGTKGWECKSWNQDLVASLSRGELADEYRYQLEHQILVGGLDFVLFTVSDGTEAKTLSIEYTSDPAYRAKLIAGWQQFEEDLKNYQHVEVIPAPAAMSIVALPALSVQIVGEVRSSNLPAFQDAASRAIAAINTNLQNDQDFSDAEAAIKWCDTGERDLETVKRMAVGQMASIDELFRTVDALSEQMRTKRLALQKLVKERKDAIRAEILQEGVKAFAKHIAALNERIGQNYMPDMRPDFAGAMKNKRTIASLRDAINVTLLNSKIEADEIAGKIAVNVRQLAEHPDHRFLFNDAHTLVQMDPQAFAAVVENRIAKHKAEQERKEAEARERIRKEEEARAAAKAQAEAKAQADKLAEESRAKIREEVKAEVRAEVKAEVAATNVTPSTATAPAQSATRTTSARGQSHVPPRPLPTPARAAPPRDGILMLVADKYSVPKPLAAKWLHELFATENQ